MPIQVSVQKRGLDLAVLPDLIGSKARRKLNKRVVDFAYQEMRDRAPLRTGVLKGSIIKLLREFEGYVGSAAPYAVYVEYGTRPHTILPVNARVLAFEVAGRTVFSPIVRHPGTRPQPFMRETAEEVKRRIPEFWNEIWREEMG
jgi:HK97 gp10 family phage protein